MGGGHRGPRRGVWLLLLAQAASIDASGPIGMDIGSANSVVATPRLGGVDVLVNEESRRQTPSLVTFDDNRRVVGQSAAALQAAYPENCVCDIKSRIAAVSDQLAVQCRGEVRRFTRTQLLAMLLHKLQSCAQMETGSVPSDYTLAVPLRFDAVQRQAVLDAAHIAGLRGVRLISDGGAIALDYALGRAHDLPDSKKLNVAFVDAGHCGVQVCIASLRRDCIRLVSHAYAADSGGAALDELVLQHLAAEFNTNFKVDACSFPRARTRLLQASERVRRVLSANLEGHVALECLVGDVDVRGTLSREQLESMAQPLIHQAVDACRKALHGAQLEPSSLHAVELVGGFSRTPCFVQAIRDYFNKEPSRTLNAEESVARGAALAAAMQSRSFRTRPLRLEEGLLQAMQVSWKPLRGSEPTGSLTLAAGTLLPLQQRASLRTKVPLLVTCRNSNASAPGELAYRVGVPKKRRRGVIPELLLEVALDEGQIPSIAAYEVDALDEVNCTTHSMNKTACNDTAGELDTNATSTLPAAQPERIDRTRERPIEVVMLSDFGLPDEDLQNLIAVEQELQKEVVDFERVLAAKNELEAAIYETRAAFLEDWAEYMNEAERDELRSSLDSKEEWLYNDGSDETLERYQQQRDALRASVEPFDTRRKIFMKRLSQLVDLNYTASRLRELEHRSHSISATLQEAHTDILDAVQLLQQQKRHDPPRVAADEVQRFADALRSIEVDVLQAHASSQQASQSCLNEGHAASQSHVNEDNINSSAVKNTSSCSHADEDDELDDFELD